ncbi:hypothetical protein EI94DRAFT_1745149 [Lactarius quietus]|nr:hypothetical protein EI94DRAFT_1745149 [Lactarius quietus]
MRCCRAFHNFEIHYFHFPTRGTLSAIALCFSTFTSGRRVVIRKAKITHRHFGRGAIMCPT